MTIIYKIAKKYGVQLIRVKSGDKHCQSNGEDRYINTSYSAGNEIWIGIYEDRELRLLSFFHEMGHVINKIDWSVNADETTSYKSEKRAWELGLKLAKENGIFFSVNAIDWANNQLGSYHKIGIPLLTITRDDDR